MEKSTQYTEATKTESKENANSFRAQLKVNKAPELGMTFEIEGLANGKEYTMEHKPSLDKKATGTGPLRSFEKEKGIDKKKFKFSHEGIMFRATVTPKTGWSDVNDWQFGYVQNIVSGKEIAIYGGKAIPLDNHGYPILDTSAATQAFPWAQKVGSQKQVFEKESPITETNFHHVAKAGQAFVWLDDSPGFTLPFEITIDGKNYPFEQYSVNQEFNTSLIAYNAKTKQVAVLATYPWRLHATLERKEDDLYLSVGDGKKYDTDGLFEAVTIKPSTHNPTLPLLTGPSTLETKNITRPEIEKQFGVDRQEAFLKRLTESKKLFDDTFGGLASGTIETDKPVTEDQRRSLLMYEANRMGFEFAAGSFTDGSNWAYKTSSFQPHINTLASEDTAIVLEELDFRQEYAEANFADIIQALQNNEKSILITLTTDGQHHATLVITPSKDGASATYRYIDPRYSNNGDFVGLDPKIESILIDKLKESFSGGVNAVNIPYQAQQPTQSEGLAETNSSYESTVHNIFTTLYLAKNGANADLSKMHEAVPALQETPNQSKNGGLDSGDVQLMHKEHKEFLSKVQKSNQEGSSIKMETSNK